MAIKNNPIIYLTAKMWQYSQGNRPRVVLFLILCSIANITFLCEPLIVAKVLNMIQQEGVHQGNLVKILLWLTTFVIIAFAFWVFHGPGRVMEEQNAFFVRAKYKKFLLDGVMSLPAAWHTDHHSGDTIDKVEKGTEALFKYSSETFEVTQNVVRLIFAYFILIYFNVHASYIVGLSIIVTIYLILQFDKRLEKQYKDLNRMENKISAKIYDTIGNITTVIILRIEKLVSKAIYRKIMVPWKLFKRNIRLNETKWFIVSMCGSIMTFFVIASYVTFNVVAGTAVLFGTVYLLYSYVEKIQWMFFNFAYLYGEKLRQKTSVMNAEELTQDFPQQIAKERSELPGNWKELNIVKLNFAYQGTEDDNLDLEKIKMKLKHGEKIAFVGASGSGKTTMMKLIRGLYQPQDLELGLDDQDLPDGFDAISGDIALIPQDPEIFNSTIKNNITVGVSYSMEQINKYCKITQIDEVIAQLPHQFNSSIVEKGVNLSGGEKQRLALARGLMASMDKEIILLDEPTSSVDSKNELIIYENIFREFSQKTIISSIHRLHLLPMFDFIYLFKHGKIIAHGSLQELLQNSSDFKVLWDKYHQTNE